LGQVSPTLGRYLGRVELRSRRILVAAIVAVLVAGAFVAVSAVQGDSSTDTRATTPTTAAQKSLFAGIPQHGIVLGSPNAPVTLVEFADLQCPFCGEFARDALPRIVQEYVRTGRVKIVFQGLAFLGPDSKTALRAVLAAGLQNRAWNLLDGLYAQQGAENSGWVTPALLRDVAGDVSGLNVQRMLDQRQSASVTRLLRDAESSASQARVRGTPTFFVGRSGGPLQPVALTRLTAAALRPALDAALQG
jgi:protein-disulfide isomerase